MSHTMNNNMRDAICSKNGLMYPESIPFQVETRYTQNYRKNTQ